MSTTDERIETYDEGLGADSLRWMGYADQELRRLREATRRTPRCIDDRVPVGGPR